MKLATFVCGGQERFGVLAERGLLGLVPGAALCDPGQVAFLPPVPRPAKILLLAGNYSEHVEESGAKDREKLQQAPRVFMKPPSTTLIGHERPIIVQKTPK